MQNLIDAFRLTCSKDDLRALLCRGDNRDVLSQFLLEIIYQKKKNVCDDLK